VQEDSKIKIAAKRLSRAAYPRQTISPNLLILVDIGDSRHIPRNFHRWGDRHPTAEHAFAAAISVRCAIRCFPAARHHSSIQSAAVVCRWRLDSGLKPVFSAGTVVTFFGVIRSAMSREVMVGALAAPFPDHRS